MRFLFIAVAALTMSSCVMVRFPENVLLKIDGDLPPMHFSQTGGRHLDSPGRSGHVFHRRHGNDTLSREFSYVMISEDSMDLDRLMTMDSMSLRERHEMIWVSDQDDIEILVDTILGKKKRKVRVMIQKDDQ